jgi:hypothetical protein
MLKKMLLLIVGVIVLSSCALLQKMGNKQARPSIARVAAKTDTAKIDTSKKATKIKPYKEVITNKAISLKGFITVHKIEDRYFFEIPDSLLSKDILIVNRISKAAADDRPVGGFLGYAGDEINENVVRFSKGVNNKIMIQRISYLMESKDSSENGMYHSVLNSSFQPIVAAFDIKAFSPDSAGAVVDITDYLNGDNDVFFFSAQYKKSYGLESVQADKSYTENILAFPMNIEIHSVKTYKKGDNLNTYRLNSSMVLLPENPMKPRHSDDRVGYFKREYIDFDQPQRVKMNAVITRWRIESKDEDIERYKKGELVEPKKPIIYYIDPATPKKWIPYLIQGVKDWQQTFEKVGFKNAIYALEAPKNDTTWSLEDARHNVIIYKASYVPNAYGPHVHDPRTGEILEAHIQWFHNVMELLHDYYMVQAGPNDTGARKMQFDDTLMGRLIRYVCAHEVGHSLGLMHNFGASSTVPVDSLRNKTYLEKNGYCPSIMDYARFNYVAQPEDSIPRRDLMPRIGVYDNWAIEWGYKWLPELKTEKDEKMYMDHWIISRIEKDPRLWFATFSMGTFDPRNQAEDIGDDAMKAGLYGIRNLKRIVPRLIEWTYEPGTDYKMAFAMQAQVFNQYYRYLKHVANNIGGIMENTPTREQQGVVYDFPSREKQRSAVQFLQGEIFATPEWLINPRLFPYTGIGGANAPLSIQKHLLFAIMSYTNFEHLMLFEKIYPDRAYTYKELLDDLTKGIWKELLARQIIDAYRRNLQKAYAERLISLLLFSKYQDPISYLINIEEDRRLTDFYSIVKSNMKKLFDLVRAAVPYYKDEMTQAHLIDIRERLQQALNPGLFDSSPLSNKVPASGPGFNNDSILQGDLYDKKLQRLSNECWADSSEKWLNELLNPVPVKR